MTVVENIDLSHEIQQWKDAVKGKDVRLANVSSFEKIQGSVNETVQNVNQAAADASDASRQSQEAVGSIEGAIATAAKSAGEAALSATAAAASSEAAATSAVGAAASAAEAEKIVGFDGTAQTVMATDTYGMVVDALGESTAQALIDAIAEKVMNQLIGKSQIINNLLATVPGNVLDAVQGKNLADKDADLQDQVARLNGDWFIIPRKIISITGGAATISDSRVGNNFSCFVTSIYAGLGVENYFYTPQVSKGSLILYVRNADGQDPPDGTKVVVDILFIK